MPETCSTRALQTCSTRALQWCDFWGPRQASAQLAAAFQFCVGLGPFVRMRRIAAATMAAMLPASNNFRAMAMKPNFRVAVLGDAHGDFLTGECAVLERVAKPDLFLAVGDFDNESLDIIRRVAAATKDLSGAAHLILGNHDAWRSSRTGTVSETLRAIRDAVSPDLDVAYRRVEVPSATGVFSVVGARPLSWGGGLAATTKKSWALLKELYGVSTP